MEDAISRRLREAVGDTRPEYPTYFGLPCTLPRATWSTQGHSRTR